MAGGNLLDYSWPAARVGEAIEMMARKSGLLTSVAELLLPPDNIRAIMSSESEAGLEVTGRWIEAVASRLDLEVEPVEAYYPEAETLVTNAAPALIRLPASTLDENSPRFLALVRNHRRSISLLTPDGSVHRVRPEAVRSAICRPLELPLVEPIDRLLTEAGIPEDRLANVRQAIILEQLSQVKIGDCWLLRFAPSAPMWPQARRARLPREMLTFLAVHVVQYLLFIASWVFVGRAVLNDTIETGWLMG